MSDLDLARETAAEMHDAERKNDRKRARVEALERVEDTVVGRDGMLEKKRTRREADRSFRDRGDDGFEADERTLLGGGDSFKEHCVGLGLFAMQYLVDDIWVTGWLDEMLLGGDSRRNAGRRGKTRCPLHGSVRMRCMKKMML